MEDALARVVVLDFELEEVDAIRVGTERTHEAYEGGRKGGEGVSREKIISYLGDFLCRKSQTAQVRATKDSPWFQSAEVSTLVSHGLRHENRTERT